MKEIVARAAENDEILVSLVSASFIGPMMDIEWPGAVADLATLSCAHASGSALLRPFAALQLLGVRHVGQVPPAVLAD